jgi:hypothetical protein
MLLHAGIGSPSSAHAPTGKKGKHAEAKLITEAEKETIIGHVAEVHSTPSHLDHNDSNRTEVQSIGLVVGARR